MTTSNRRGFLGIVGGSLAALSTSGGQAQPPAAEKGRERLARALAELNEAAGIGITPEEFERAKGYATGVHLEAQAKFRSLFLREDLDLPVHFSARRKP